MKTLRIAGWVSAFMLLVLLSASPAWSQTAALSGTITDPSGASVAGAEVTITNEATGASRTTTTESDGKYVFNKLAPAKYKVEIKAQGFKTTVRQHLEVLVGITTTLDLRLEMGTVAETMVVEAAAAGVNTTDASIGTPISGSELASLPILDMNPAALLGLQAGVAFIPTQADNPAGYGGVSEDDGRSGSVNGARSDQTNVTLDGIDVNDPTKGYAFTSVLRVPQASLAEFRTTTTSYDADSGGRSSAAQVQLVSKSGTNDIHGSAYYSHRNEALNANDFFLNRDDIKEPKFRHHLYGVTAGGPVIKNRIFLFGNFERLTESLFKSALRDVPSAAFKDGVFFYECRTDIPQPPGVQCDALVGSFVSGLSGSYGLDSNNQPCRQGSSGCGPIPAAANNRAFYALTPAQIAAIDPLGIGPNLAIVGPAGYYAQFPDPNTTGNNDNLNLLGLRFGAPVNNLFNTAVIRADVHLDRADKHTLFWRGSLMHDTVNIEPQFPGQPPLQTILNNNKGFAVGYTALLTNHLVNSFHYGLTRISGKTAGIRNQEFVDFRFIDNFQGFETTGAFNNSTGRILPQHHFRDDVSWTKGVHSFSFGGEFRRTRNATFSNANSFHTFLINPSWLPNGAREIEPGQPRCVSPGCDQVPINASGRSFRDLLTQMLGPISQVDAFYNFDRTGTTQPVGDPVRRRFGVNEYELYAQDKWRFTPSLTLTFGLRWYVGSPPWETNGNQVTPTPSLGTWFDCRQSALLAGQPSQSCGLIQTDLGGPENGGTGYYEYDYNNFSPRIAFAWTPRFREGFGHWLSGEGKLSIRGGYSAVYDRIGNGIATSFDSFGSFGLSTNITSFFGGCGIGNNDGPQSQDNPCTRFTGISDTAAAIAQSLQPSPGGSFPSTPPEGLLTVTSGLDDRIRTPYAHTIDFSIARELPGNLTVEAAYVGRLAHKLSLIRDYGMPADLRDPASGVRAFEAARQLEAFAEQNASVFGQGLLGMAPISYWENLFPGFGPAGINGGCLQFDVFGLGAGPDGDPNTPADNLPTCGYSPTQVAYDYMIGYHGTAATGSGFGTSTFWQDVDYFGFPAYPFCANGTDIPQIDTDGDGMADLGDGIPDCPNTFFPSQYVNLHSWTTVGYSKYHGLQLMLRKRTSHGVSFAFNYTLSKSLDTSSTPERQDIFGGQTLTGGVSGTTINSWDIRQEYAASDFDIRHQLNGYWIAELPFGRGKRLGSQVPGWANQFIGGWQVSGVLHVNSGAPANIGNGRTWPTNWNLTPNGTCAPVGAYPFGLAVGPCPSTQNVHGATHGTGTQPTPNLFGNPGEAIRNFRFTATGFRGQRNVIRADKFFNLNFGIAKSFSLTERMKLFFRWDMFNLTNSVYFDANGLNTSPEDPATFGDYTKVLGAPRQMQVSMKFVF